MMSGAEVALALLCGTPLLLLAAGAGYLGLRALSPRRSGDDSARNPLDRRLVLGEIDAAEYLERESLLRDAAPAASARRTGRWPFR
jgi:hypothetical protein